MTAIAAPMSFSTRFVLVLASALAVLLPAASAQADIVIDGTINVTDLLNVIANWNQPGGPADVNYDGIVNVADLLIVIGSWGPCN